MNEQSNTEKTKYFNPCKDYRIRLWGYNVDKSLANQIIAHRQNFKRVLIINGDETRLFNHVYMGDLVIHTQEQEAAYRMKLELFDQYPGQKSIFENRRILTFNFPGILKRMVPQETNCECKVFGAMHNPLTAKADILIYFAKENDKGKFTIKQLVECLLNRKGTLYVIHPGASSPFGNDLKKYITWTDKIGVKISAKYGKVHPFFYIPLKAICMIKRLFKADPAYTINRYIM